MEDAAAPEAAAGAGQQEPEPPVTRYYVLLFQSGDDEDPRGDMNRYVLHLVKEEAEDKITTPPDGTEIDIWLESPGGSASVAYKLFLELRSRCRKLRVVVPDYAKSAATLLTLGGDEIYMPEAAELGPLDAQIEHPDREGVTVSALEVAKAFDFLGTFAAGYAVSGGGQILKWTELPRTDVLREFLRFSALFLKPAVAKLDPHLVYRATNQLDLAHRYAEIMLGRRRLSDADKEGDGDHRLLVERLVRDYPAHEFVISKDEARGLGLPVRDADDYPRWDHVRKFHTVFRRRLFRGLVGSVVDIWDDSDFEDEPEEEGEQPNGGNAHE